MNLAGERIEVKRRERILVIDDDPGFSEVVQLLLAGEGYRAEVAGTVRAGLRAVHAAAVDLVITDLKLPDATGLDAIRELRALDRELPIILMTSYSSVESAVEALRNGAVDYVIKPFNNDDFLHAVERALAEARIRRENALLKRSLRKAWADRRMIGESAGMRRVGELVRKVAPSDANVLIWGESGTGKELVARNIHRASNRGDGPFVAINCGAIPAELLESELFGHAKGAFTGATHATEGLIREAHGGTLFLDEIAELPLALQVKLLRVLQDREVRPVGGKQVVNVDVRFVAATNRDLKELMEKGDFREDLFYRLNVINIHVPPLRERGADVRRLADHFVEVYGRKLGKPVRGIGDDLAAFLATYHWPGNVRELENLIERAVILAESDTLTAKEFAEMRGAAAGRRGAPAAGDRPLSVEAYIQDVVRRFQDRYSETELARALGIGRKALWMRRRQWGLQRKRGGGPKE
jgi:DNA-binding NtrC family response regulator